MIFQLVLFIVFFFSRTIRPNPALSFLSSSHYRFLSDEISNEVICVEHDHELLKPQLITTWMPNAVGSAPGKNVIFAETQVSQFSNKMLSSVRSLGLLSTKTNK